ncbi:hypothetical protein C4573_07350 [Candidatus Woesearchaeota archaeon]|nr:MAG: hypothetical protein C4573_07350 [Candidatus Woesearchaeota archaeon]
MLLVTAVSAGLLGNGCNENDQVVNTEDCTDCDKPSQDTLYVTVPPDTVYVPADTVSISADTVYAYREMLPKGLNVCIDTLAIDLCKDITFNPHYVPNSSSGIRDIIFEKVPNDDCGYISAETGGIIGREEGWFVRDILGYSLDDSAAVNSMKQKIGNDITLQKVWMRDMQGNNGSIIINAPYSATKVEVELDARPASNTGIGWFVRNGVIDIDVHAYGQTRQASQSTHQVIDIVNPTLMPFEIAVPLGKDVYGPIKYLTPVQWDSLKALDGWL